MPKASSKSKKKANLRMVACKHLIQLNQSSNAGNPLCHCEKRDFNLSPYNHVCQVCTFYSENSADILHSQIFKADDAPNFIYDEESIAFEMPDIEEDEDVIVDEEFEDEIVVSMKKKSKKKKKVVDEEDDDEIEDLSSASEEDEEELIIGHEKKEKSDDFVDYEDEREEGLGKKHGTVDAEEELDEELEEYDDDDEIADEDTGASSGANNDNGIDFEAEVINKIQVIGEGETRKEICPFCKKSKVSVLRHLPKCKRTPPEIIAAYNIYKKKKKKKK
ncbi:MAG: hypothetical protein ACTSVU_04460 [Promethearchaeota archaeon]